MFLDFNVSTYTFNESDGEVSNIIEVQKRDLSLETEVDIPIQVLALSGTADTGIIYNCMYVHTNQPFTLPVWCPAYILTPTCLYEL